MSKRDKFQASGRSIAIEEDSSLRNKENKSRSGIGEDSSSRYNDYNFSGGFGGGHSLSNSNFIKQVMKDVNKDAPNPKLHESRNSEIKEEVIKPCLSRLT